MPSRIIAAILLDGKVVLDPINFNVDEGWVEMQIPVQADKPTTLETGQTTVSSSDISEFHWEVVRKKGKVKLIYMDNSVQDIVDSQ